MIPARIQIDGKIYDTYKKFGLIYLDADEIVEAPIKSREVTKYAGEQGEHVNPLTVADAFDYTVQFLVEAKREMDTDVNSLITYFNSQLYKTTNTPNVREYKEVTFFNDLNKVAITGIPEPITVPTDANNTTVYGGREWLRVEFKIRVTTPSKCSFTNLSA